jgi:hypothetical protein
LPHLQVLALGAAVGDRKLRDGAAALCVELLDSWLVAFPPFDGIGWINGLDCAHRVVSMLQIAALLPDESLDPPLRHKVWTSLRVHGLWIERYLSLDSSGQGHRLSELAALVMLAALAPQLPEADRWQRSAALQEEAELQILADGVGAEQSTACLSQTLEWLLLARSACKQAGLPLAIDERLAAAATFLAALADPEGNIPDIGDNDGGAVSRPFLADPLRARSLQGCVAAALIRPGLAPRGWSIDLRGLSLGLLPLQSHSFAAPESRHFPNGGLTTLRGRTTQDSSVLLVFDHGPLGCGFAAAHGHADALSLWLHLGGRPVLVDGGTWRYDGRGRAWNRSTASHNTVSVDGLDQSIPGGDFSWRYKASARAVSLDLDAGRVQGAHDGYDERIGVMHFRTVQLQGDVISVTDQLDGEGEHDVRSAWHFAPGTRLSAEDETWLLSDGGGPLLSIGVQGAKPSSASVRARLEVPTEPGPGLHSPSYGRLVAAPALILETRLKLPVRWTTRFVLLR